MTSSPKLETGLTLVTVLVVLVLLLGSILATVFAYTPLGAMQAWRASIGAVWLNAILGELVPLLSPHPGARPGTRGA